MRYSRRAQCGKPIARAAERIVRHPNMKSTATLAVLMLAALRASADMPPAEFLAVQITVSTTATVYQNPPLQSMRKASPPMAVMNGYIWREHGDTPVEVTTNTPVGVLGSRGNAAEIHFSLADDLFEISKPKKLLIVTGYGSMTIMTSDIRKVAPYKGPLDGRQIYAENMLALTDAPAKLLRSGPPKFTCGLGHEPMSERLLLSYSKKLTEKDFSAYCVSDPGGAQRITTPQLEALTKSADIVVLRLEEPE